VVLERRVGEVNNELVQAQSLKREEEAARVSSSSSSGGGSGGGGVLNYVLSL